MGVEEAVLRDLGVVEPEVLRGQEVEIVEVVERWETWGIGLAGRIWRGVLLEAESLLGCRRETRLSSERGIEYNLRRVMVVVKFWQLGEVIPAYTQGLVF